MSGLAALSWPPTCGWWAGSTRHASRQTHGHGARRFRAVDVACVATSIPGALQRSSSLPPRRRQQWQRQRGRPPAGTDPAFAKVLHGMGVTQLLQLADSEDLTAAHALRVLDALLAATKPTKGAPAQQAAGLAEAPQLRRLFRVLQLGCEDLQIQDLVLMLRRCVALGLHPSRALLSEATEQLCHRLPAEAPSEACLAAWALTRLRHSGVGSLLTAIDAQVQRQVAAQQRAAQQQSQEEEEEEEECAAAEARERQEAAEEGQHQQQQAVAGNGQPEAGSGQSSPAAAAVGAAAAAAAAVLPPPPWLARLPPQLLIHLLWSCGKASFRSQLLLTGICQALLASEQATFVVQQGRGSGSRKPLGKLNAQQLATIFYSLGCLQWAPSPEFCRHACAHAQRQLPSCSPQGLANIAWALPKLGFQPGIETLAAALSHEAAPRLAAFSNQELCMLLMAVAGHGNLPAWRGGRAAGLLGAAGEQLAERAVVLDDRDLVGMLSALATAGHRPSDAALAATAARAEALLPGGLAPATLGWLLWSFAHLKHRPPRSLLKKAEAALRGPHLLALYSLEGADMARICWALAELDYYSGALLSDLAGVLRGMWDRLPPQSMAMVLHSYAQQGFTPHELLDAAAEHLAAHLPEYEPQAVAMVMWTFGKLGVHPGRGLPVGAMCTPDGTSLMTAVAAYAEQHAQQGPPRKQQAQQAQKGALAGAQQAQRKGQHVLTLQGLAMLLWSFATLEHHPGPALLEAASVRFVSALRRDQAAAARSGGSGSGGSKSAAFTAGATEDAASTGSVLGGSSSGAGAKQQAEGRQEEQAKQGQQGQQGRGATCLRSVAQAAWGFAKFGFADEAFFAAVAARLPAAAASKDIPQSLTLVAYSAAKLRVAAAQQLLLQVLPLAERHAGDFTSEELCQLVWALATVGGLQAAVPLPLLDAAASRLASDVGGGDGGSTGRAGGTVDTRLLCLGVHALACLQYCCSTALLDACARHLATAGADVPVSLLAKFLWGCAHVGHEPEPEALETIIADLYYRLSHSRGNRTLLNVPDLVLLLWSLAALQQYGSQLYRNAAFRATRLPDGVPEQPRLRRLLREATVLHSCEHRLDPVAAEAAAAILPAWLASQQAAAAEQRHAAEVEQAAEERTEGTERQQQQQAAEQQQGAWERPMRAAGVGGAESSGAAAAAGGTGPPPQERRAEAEAAAGALQRAGVPASLKQLSYGDYIVILESQTGSGGSGGGGSGGGGSNARRPARPHALAAVVPATPATGRAAVNDPHRLLGSALVAQRVLEARGLLVVPGTGSGSELVERCATALSEQRQQKLRRRQAQQEALEVAQREQRV